MRSRGILFCSILFASVCASALASGPSGLGAPEPTWFDLSAQEGHKIEVFPTGAETYAARIEMIERAKRSILFSAFGIFDDKGAWEVLAPLCRRAKEGLDVRVLLDAYGSKKWLAPEKQKILRDCGMQLLFDASSHPWTWDSVFAIHEKLLIVDGLEFITGGSGLSDFNKHSGRGDKTWHDLDVRITGPAACWYHRRFAANWRGMAGRAQQAFLSSELGRMRPLREFRFNHPPIPDCVETVAGTARVLPRYNNPFFSSERPLLQAHLEATRASLHEIFLYAPYFIPSERMIEELIRAKVERDVKVTVLTNSELSTDENPDLVMLPMFNRIKPLLDAGIELRLWKKTSTMHRKGGMFDGRWVYFGSDNQDNRAQEYSSESIVFTDDAATLELMTREIADDLADSRPVDMKYVKKVQNKFGDFGKFVTGLVEGFL